MKLFIALIVSAAGIYANASTITAQDLVCENFQPAQSSTLITKLNATTFKVESKNEFGLPMSNYNLEITSQVVKSKSVTYLGNVRYVHALNGIPKFKLQYNLKKSDKNGLLTVYPPSVSETTPYKTLFTCRIETNRQTLTGVLRKTYGIGGENSGISLFTSSSVVELEFSTPELKSKAFELLDRTVVVEGKISQVNGVEIPVRDIFIADVVAELVN